MILIDKLKHETLMLEENRIEYLFDSVYQAVEYYLTKSPVKQKSQSIEPVGGCKPAYHELDPRHPARIWATLSIGFGKLFNDLTVIEQYAFRWIFKMYPANFGFPEIAKYHGVDERQLKKSKRYVKERLEDFLMTDGLMEMPKYWQPAERHYHYWKGQAGRPRKQIL